MKYLVIIPMLIFSTLCFGQVEDSIATEEVVYDVVETQPEFPGGNEALFKFIASNIKYPAISKDNGIQGKVYIQFIIDKNGKVRDAKVIRGVDSELDKEALRVVNMMPRWKPGTQSGKPVNVRYNLPIVFKLSD